MSALADAVDRLRSAVRQRMSGTEVDLAGGVDRSFFEHPNATARALSVDPVVPTTVAELEDFLGGARRLPRNPSGGPVTVLFGDTMPAEGGADATVLAEVDDDDRVLRLIVRADSY